MAVESMCFDNMTTGYVGSQVQDWCINNPGFGIDQEMHHHVQSASFVNQSAENAAASFAHSLVFDIEKHMKELDWYLHWENKRLRRSILQESKRQQAMILQKYDSLIRALMVQKEEEIAAARCRTRELHDLFTAAEIEAKVWENRAREKEALVSELNKKLNQAAAAAAAKEDYNDDAVSFCGSSSGGDCLNKKMMTMAMAMGMACKLCQARSLCVVFLPCRHLCCCNFCDSLLGQCPVCQTVKEASLEVCLG